MKNTRSLGQYLAEAELRLRIKRGRFRYVPELGSRLYLIAGEEQPEQRAKSFSEEALLPMPELMVMSALREKGGFRISLLTPSGTGEVFIAGGENNGG